MKEIGDNLIMIGIIILTILGILFIVRGLIALTIIAFEASVIEGIVISISMIAGIMIVIGIILKKLDI